MLRYSFLFVLILPGICTAQTKNWNVATFGNHATWHNANHWTPNGIPTLANDVSIAYDPAGPSDGSDVKIVQGALANSLYLGELSKYAEVEVGFGGDGGSLFVRDSIFIDSLSHIHVNGFPGHPSWLTSLGHTQVGLPASTGNPNPDVYPQRSMLQLFSASATVDSLDIAPSAFVSVPTGTSLDINPEQMTRPRSGILSMDGIFDGESVDDAVLSADTHDRKRTDLMIGQPGDAFTPPDPAFVTAKAIQIRNGGVPEFLTDQIGASGVDLHLKMSEASSPALGNAELIIADSGDGLDPSPLPSFIGSDEGVAGPEPAHALIKIGVGSAMLVNSSPPTGPAGLTISKGTEVDFVIEGPRTDYWPGPHPQFYGSLQVMQDLILSYTSESISRLTLWPNNSLMIGNRLLLSLDEATNPTDGTSKMIYVMPHGPNSQMANVDIAGAAEISQGELVVTYGAENLYESTDSGITTENPDPVSLCQNWILFQSPSVAGDFRCKDLPSTEDRRTWLNTRSNPILQTDHAFYSRYFPNTQSYRLFIGKLILGDINQDGLTDFNDFLILSTNFGMQNATFCEGDLNGNGTVDFADFLILSDNFGEDALEDCNVSW